MTGRHYMLAAALASAAAAVGFACGTAARPAKPAPRSTLPAAGSPQDDGTGLLARLSMATPERGGDLALGDAGRAVGGGASYGGAQYGMYGGMLYGGRTGGNRYGGSRYANYRFEAGLVPITTAPSVAPYEDYTPQTLTDGGAIEGVVTWPRPPRALASLPGRGAGCRDELPNETLQVADAGSTKHAVGGAVVYLERIKAGRTATPTGGVLERRGCRLRPHVQLSAPIGAPLRITNSDEARASLRLSRVDGDGEPLDVELAGDGQTSVRSLDRAGFYRVQTREAGDLASAYVIAPRHPYYVITDDDGRFRLDSVPPGTYALVVWHEPVAVEVDAAGALTMTKPFVAKKNVKVTAHKTTAVTVQLPAGR